MPVFPFSAAVQDHSVREFEPALAARERENFVRLLYLAQFPEIAAAGVYAASMAGQIGWTGPLNWLGLVWLVMTVRFFVINRALADSAELHNNFNFVLLANCSCGLCWGISAFYLTHGASEAALYIVMIWLVGMIVSAMGLAAVSSRHPILWASPVVIALMVRLLLEGNQTFTLMAVGVVMLILLFGAIVYFTREIIRRDFYREMQNASLVEQLSEANTYATRLNEELRLEISQREKIEAALRHERDQAERLSTTDSLTGISNRRAFDNALQDEIQRARREQNILSLILIDVDRFKNYNDARGHQAGDDVLRQVARIIEQSTRRGTDKSCRYGGEEFAVLLPNTDITHAARIAEAIRAQLEAEQIVHPDSDVGPHVTISLGVSAMVPNDRNAGETLLSVADRALYRAKTAGRNQTHKIH